MGGKKIGHILEKRNIEWLVHFTREENLMGILKEGLIPRKEIDIRTVMVNDDYRFDNCEDANCLSVEFPNYKMLYTLCRNNPETRWVVLALDTNIIEEYPCAFCYSNAGSEEIYSIPIKDRMTVSAFESIFEEREGYPTRERLGIPEYYPTNPQAEILVFGTINPKYIKYAIFRDEEMLNKYKSIIPPRIKAIVDEDYFYGRCDYKYWQKVEV